MTIPLVLLRLRIMGRVAAELPRTEPFAAVVVIAMLGAAQWRLFAWASHPTGGWLVTACNVAVLLAVHAARRDEPFLRIAGVRYRRLFAAEYLLLCVSFSFPLLLSDRPQLAAVGPASALLISLLPAGLLPAIVAQRAQRRVPMPLLLPVTAFEWLAGIRRSALGLSILYLAAALLSLQVTVLVTVLVLAVLTPAAFYQDGEGSTLVEVLAMSPGAFLRCTDVARPVLRLAHHTSRSRLEPATALGRVERALERTVPAIDPQREGVLVHHHQPIPHRGS